MLIYIKKAAMYWKMMLDVSIATAVIGGIAFVTNVKQKKEFLYMNRILIALLCLIYSFYFLTVRKDDMGKWLEENNPFKSPCIRYVRRKLGNIRSKLRFNEKKFRTLIHVGIFYLWVVFFKLVAVFLFILFPVIVLVTAWVHYHLIMPFVLLVLFFSVVFYILVVNPLLMDSEIKLIISILWTCLIVQISLCGITVWNSIFYFL